MKRGEVWWAHLQAPTGPRPVLLLSRDRVYRTRRSATIAPITTHARGIQTEVPIGPQEGLPRPSVVNVDDITTVPMLLLERHVTSLSPQKMDAVNRAIRFALDLD